MKEELITHGHMSYGSTDKRRRRVKTQQDNSEVEVGGAQTAPRVFHILANADSFRALSSSLYNDKKLAIIRELACNAWDSHVSAGKKDEPFEIHLPTTFEPWLSIKDNGTGLEEGAYPCPENDWKGRGILGLYCTYFSGDKNQTNDQIGCFGLGSKSPFCYNEGKTGFTVTSRYNGRKKVYSAYLEKGLPYIVRQTDDPTDECNGLEVQFPVKSSDSWEFSNKAEQALEFFKPKPKLNVSISIKKQEYDVKTKKWGLRKNSYINGLRAIQGMVPYGVGDIDESLLSEKHKKVIELPIDIFFKIGEVSPAVSREALSNDDTTIKNILAALDEVADDFVSEVKKQLKEFKTEWEARLFIFNKINVPGLGGLINEAYQQGSLDGKYEGYSLNHTPLSINELDYSKATVVKFKSNYRTKSAYKNSVFPLKEEDRKLALDKIILNPKSKGSYDRAIEIEPKVLFVMNDVGFGAEKYIHYYLQERNDHSYNIVYFITRAHKDIANVDALIEGQAILSTLGNPPFKYVSEIKAIYPKEKAQKEATPYVKRELLWFDVRNNISRFREGYEAAGWRDGWETIDINDDSIDWSNTRYYVEVKKLVPTTGGFKFAEDFGKLIEKARRAKILGLNDDSVIFGIPEGSSLLNKPGWVEFTDYVYTELVKVMTPQKELELSLLQNQFNYPSQLIEEVLKTIGIVKPFSIDSEIQVFSDALAEAEKIDKTALTALQWIVDKAKEKNLYKPGSTAVLDYNKTWKEVVKGYPLLPMISHYYSNKHVGVQHVIDYLKLVEDAKNKKEEQEVVTLAIAIAEKEKEKEKQYVTIN